MNRVLGTISLLAMTPAFLPLQAADQPVRVVTLSTVLTEIVATVGGDAVAVHGLVPPAADPHGFDPSPQDIRRCIDADIVFASGFGLEPYLERLIANVGIRGRIIVVADVLHDPVVFNDDHDEDNDHEHAHDHAHGHDDSIFDPHWWHSPEAVRAVSTHVADELIAARPAAMEAIRQRLQAWLTQLRELETWAQSQIAPLPAERRKLVTSHDAFGWLARDLGFTVHPIKGLSADAEPSGRQMAALVELIREHGITAVFAENVENPRLLAALSKETGARTGGTLFADGPGAPGSGAETYAAMYRHNVTTIVTGLLDR